MLVVAAYGAFRASSARVARCTRVVAPVHEIVSLTHRWFSSSGKNRFNFMRRRAVEQHVDYLRQLKPPRPYRYAEVDPKLQPKVEETRNVFANPDVTKQPLEEMQLLPERLERLQSYAGVLGELHLDPFGIIEVHHGDIFEAKEKAIMLPVPPNLMPYRGLSLESFDRGGPEMVQHAFDKAQALPQESLMDGDTLSLPGKYFDEKDVIFVVMPSFWQGSPLDAAKRLRFCVRRSMSNVTKMCVPSVALPALGGGVFGYEPRSSCGILLEEAVEALLQIEEAVPNYHLRRIAFVDSRRETAEELAAALTEVSHRWLPDRRLTTAPQFWGQATRRLLVLPSKPNFFWKRFRVKFKRYHGVVRQARRAYMGNIKPNFWRAHRVQQPPPLMVYKTTGDSAPLERQLKARPYYFRGVSHWLFPSRRSGFHSLRKSSKGRWVAQPQNYRVRDHVRPRL
eukprot:TRINITY_DN49356_c0_g1_i1.p1 TRINITY_DN49356_c0_g1~~TRINITY_DN49356_c0_g1_i1.p1  ORF type:complete len:466 (+),score=68.94 TRINITY_DN49356_c0_g1_i1:43-1398(+)